RREGRNSMEPIRSGRDPWDGRERERERDPREREREQRDREREMHEREREMREREQDRRRGYEREESRPPGPPIKGRDWEARDYAEGRREWDGRGRRGPPPEWENAHRGDWGDKEVPLPLPHPMPHPMGPIEGEWGCFPGPGGDWAPGADRRVGWVEEWGERQGLGIGPPIGMGGPPPGIPGRPPPRMLPHRDEPPLLMIPREVKVDETSHEDGAKKIHEEIGEKDALIDGKEDKLSIEGVKLEESPSKKTGESSNPSTPGKRPRDASDNEIEKPEVKKLSLEDSVPLEGDLSDISDDDADEILNREDSELIGPSVAGESAAPITAIVSGNRDVLMREPEREIAEREETGVQEINIDSRSVLISSRIEDRAQDDEMDNLDFEEISDEELDPEEAKTGIGDALGVDWASLVAESRPRAKPDSTPGSARRRWESHRVLARLGVSVRFAGWDLVEDLKSKYEDVKQEEVKGDEKENVRPQTGNDAAVKEEAPTLNFLHPVASIHVALRERQAKRKALFASSGPYKRALSARRDLAIRRQLCNLPVKETAGDSQQAVPDVEIYRLGVQLFERSL
ncbi:hypothetical protein L9F63_016768, partial [Diploptera punctata]